MPGQSAIVVIGIGNEFRHDDAVGLLVARKLQEIAPSFVKIITGIADSAQLASALADGDVACIVDAACSGARPAGFVHCLSASHGDIPEESLSSRYSHNVSINEAMKLVELTGKRPSLVVVYGIEGSDFSQGVGMCAEVVTAADAVVNAIHRIIQRGHWSSADND